MNSKGLYLTSTKKIDCEQSLFFFRFSESNPRARERRSRETRETRAAAISHARGYLRISRFARSLQRKRKSFSCAPVFHKGDVTRDDSQRRFLAKNNVATLLRHCFEWSQHCSNIAALCCSKNRRCESSRVDGTRSSTYCLFAVLVAIPVVVV